jgi:hypothetical protein
VALARLTSRSLRPTAEQSIPGFIKLGAAGTWPRTLRLFEQAAEGTGNMPSDNSSDQWRALAAEVRAIAAELRDPEAKRLMLKIAEAYERLARYAEARRKN